MDPDISLQGRAGHAKTASIHIVRIANHARPASPRRHPGDRGRFVAVLKAYRARTGTGKIRCLTGDLMCRSGPFRLVAPRVSRDS